MDIKFEDEIFGVPEERILANDVRFPHEYNPRNVRLWVIGNKYGPVCAAWADCEQDALDEATYAGLMDSFLLDEEDIDFNEEDIDFNEEYSCLGNAGEPADLTKLWMHAIDMNVQDIKLIIKFAEARGASVDNLYKV